MAKESLIIDWSHPFITVMLFHDASIKLQEFAENLQNSGIHGGVFVQDSNFTVDVLSRLLKIPSSKVPVLRHLSTELKLLLANAT